MVSERFRNSCSVTLHNKGLNKRLRFLCALVRMMVENGPEY